VPTLTDRDNYTDLLETIPAFSACTRKVLEEFSSHGVHKVRCSAGTTFRARTDHDPDLYVLAEGSAFLDAGEDVVIALEAGDYFGTDPGRRHALSATVVAVSDIEVLVIHPDELSQLDQASARDRHPSEIEWRLDLSTTTRRAARRTHRRAVLANRSA
jgi:CRP-like cAMP-binding protein